jgi:hypothetical protein
MMSIITLSKTWKAIKDKIGLHLVRDSSAIRRLFVWLAGAVGRQSALHKENSGFPAATQHDFALDPMISSFHFHFGIYKCDLAILTEWWQQHIAWWELLNAMCQIICIYYVNNIQITWKTIYLSVFCRTNSSIYSSNQSRRK